MWMARNLLMLNDSGKPEVIIKTLTAPSVINGHTPCLDSTLSTFSITMKKEARNLGVLFDLNNVFIAR